MKTKNAIRNIILSVFTYIAFLTYFNILFKFESFNLLIMVGYFAILLFYFKYQNKYDLCDNRTKKYSNVLSIILSISLIIGCIVYRNIYSTINIFNLKRIILALCSIFGFYNLFKLILSIGFAKVPELNIQSKKNNNRMSLKTFLIIFGLIIIAWLPYYLRYFPALMTPDSYYVIYYANNKILSDFHTFGHTWFFGGFFLLGKLLFNNLNIAVGFSMIFQIALCAFIFTSSIKTLYKYNVSKTILYIIIFIYMFSPVYALYSITLWRDVLFGMSFLSLFIIFYDITTNNYKVTKTNIINYILTVFIILFFRNNGIYIYIFMIPFMIYFMKPIRKKTTILSLTILLFYIIVKGPVFSYFKIQTTTSVEAYSIPLQQVSRVIYFNQSMDKSVNKYFSSILDYKKIKKGYNPTLSDPVKNSTNNIKLSANKGQFFTNWFKLFLRHPNTYIESYLCETLGYWYPDVVYWATPLTSKSIFKDLNVYSSSLLPKSANVIDKVSSRKIPMCILLWSPGLAFIILLFSVSIILYKKNYKYLICYIPLFALWLSIMASTPVFDEFRYIYGLIVCVPTMILMPLINIKVKQTKQLYNKN